MTSQTDLAHVMSLLQSGQLKPALKACKDGMRRYPKEAAFPNLVGIALSQSGKPKEAIPYFVKAIKRAPGNTDFQDNLLKAYIQAGQYTQAHALGEKLLARRPDDSELHYQIALMHMQRDRLDQAIASANQVIATDAATLTKAHPAQPDLKAKAARGYNLRAVIRERLGDDDGAYSDYQASLELNPNNAETLSNIAPQLSLRMRPKEALEALEKALSLNPRHVNVLHRYGIQLNENGRKNEAIDVLKMALEVDPSHAGVMRGLARMETERGAAALLPQIAAAMKTARKGTLDQALLSFAEAHCFEKTGGDVARAYRRANDQARTVRPYDRAASDARQSAILARFPLDGEPAPPAPASGPRPIFVLGQPRSGTTLIEVMLSAHPDIKTAGEQAILGRLAEPFIHSDQPFDRAAADELGQTYRRLLPGLDGDVAGVIDKMPANYALIGFILRALPNAIILNTVRDPRDVAWSMWRTWFPNTPLNYTFDMSAMAHEANLYARYMAHWKALAPGRIHDVFYEDLVTDVEAHSKSLAKLCDVNWVPAMAAPEHSAQAVRTASAHQVRQPVHSGSVGGWRRHADDMKPFLDGLDPALWQGLPD